MYEIVFCSAERFDAKFIGRSRRLAGAIYDDQSVVENAIDARLPSVVLQYS